MNEKSVYAQKSLEWHKKSGVRSNPETYELNLNEKTLSDREHLSWHLPSYSGILNHPSLKNLNNTEKEYVKGVQLLEFVSKQTIFEVDCVNVVASKIAHNKYPYQFPANIQLDALKIYTDEGYHAYYTKKIANQIKDYYETNDEDINPIIKNYYDKIENIFNKYGDKFKNICMLAFVISGENQIVGDISEQMKEIVYEPIRVMFKDHMRDEVFHAHFFSKLFEILWPQLNIEEQQIMGMAFCDSMELLGKPRTDIYYYSLKKINFSKEEIDKFICEVYTQADWGPDYIAQKMYPTINLLNNNNVFLNEKIRKVFVEKGYLKI